MVNTQSDDDFSRPIFLKEHKGFEERIIELIKDDPELHDATVKLIESFAELKHEQAMRMKERRTHIDQVR